MDLDQVIGELYDIFNEYCPDEEDFLDEMSEVANDIDEISNLEIASDSDRKNALNLLIDFNSEWMPDGVEPDEKDRIQKIIKQAEKALIELE